MTNSQAKPQGIDILARKPFTYGVHLHADCTMPPLGDLWALRAEQNPLNHPTTPAGAFILTVAVTFDPSDPLGRERLAAASRSLQRSWGLTIVKADEIPVSELPAPTPGRLRGDEAFGGKPGQSKVIGERLDSGLTATQEDRLAAKVAKAREREARCCDR